MHQNRKTSIPIQRMALLSDIHANLPALEAVYEHAMEQGAQLFLNAGDTVGYGPFPNECLDFIRFKKIISVKGDYDRKVLEFPKKKNVFEEKKHPLQVFAFRWAYEQLNNHNFQNLSNLSEFEKISIESKTLYLTHGSPLSIKAHLGPHTPQSELVLNKRFVQSDFLVTGNSHVFWKEQVGDTLFINPGSVGRQDDGDPRASYVLLSIGNSIQVDHFRVPYDATSLLKAIEVYNLPVEFSYMFENGVNLDRALIELSKPNHD
ncbi:MAG: metallophosphoesterase family protein [Anaerolineaceae bacterium]